MMPVRWAVLGTGKIARHFAESLSLSATGELTAIASRSVERSDAFAREFGIRSSYGDYADALADESIDAVYIATPHTTHAALVVAAAEAGKHVLCEKPLAVTEHEAALAVEAARRAGVFLAEGFAFRFHPQTRRALALIRSDALGEIRGIEAAFGYDAGPAPANYLHDRSLAGGAILDVGCYTVAFSRAIAGAAAHRSTAAEPISVRAAGYVDDRRGVDLSSSAVLEFADGVTAHLSCSIERNLESVVRVWGTEGELTLTEPWLPGRTATVPRLRTRSRSGATAEHAFDEAGDLYALESDHVAWEIESGQSPWMPLDDSLGNMRVLDSWRHAIGLRFDVDSASPPPRPTEPEDERPRPLASSNTTQK